MWDIANALKKDKNGRDFEMSMIEQQVKELRECVEECDNPLYDMKMKRIAKLMYQAAGTIEYGKVG